VYLATALPAIGVGVLAQSTGLPAAIQVFAYVMIAVCVAGLFGLIAKQRSRPRLPMPTT
jgi:hypothetical protein